MDSVELRLQKTETGYTVPFKNKVVGWLRPAEPSAATPLAEGTWRAIPSGERLDFASRAYATPREGAEALVAAV